MSRKKKRTKKPIPVQVGQDEHISKMEPDWTKNCENCGETPIVPFCGLCGPCCFGEADTMGGNW